MSDILDAPASPVVRGGLGQWGSIIAGAITAAAFATVLHAFGAAIGLAVTSTAPTWRDASVALWVLSGIYLILVALASYGVGGYVAGLLRDRLAVTAPHDVETADGLRGLLVWAIATLLTAVMIVLATAATARLAAPSNNALPTTSVAGENIIALDLDRLLRGEQRRGDVDVTETRAEAARILLTASGHSGVFAEDRAYLIRLVSARTGLAPADAERRVDAAVARAKENISRARRSAVILAFMAGAAALLGAAAAWFASIAGGQHHDEAKAERYTVRGKILDREVREAALTGHNGGCARTFGERPGRRELGLQDRRPIGM